MRTAFQLLGVTLALCAGCATQPRTSQLPRPTEPSTAPTQPSVQRPPPVNLSGYSPAFKQGYTDGCASARGSMRRDDARFRSDNDYMMGWSDGNSVCRNRR
ncbi:MAG TPA: hypothetical protein VJ834_05665 [Burkholderiales bacterium]|nr:hypothetical protein [Burkholderiales bacterium]